MGINQESPSQAEEDKEYHFIYFIETHDKHKNIKVSLSPDYKDSNTLEFLFQKDIYKIKNSLVSNIYRFKLYPDNNKKKKEVTIQVIIEEKSNEEILNKSIKVNDIHKDFYEYNLNMKKINPFRISYDQQFEIYIEYLRKVMKIFQKSRENEDFIISTQILLKNEKYDILFYLIIFLECFLSKLCYRHILLFKPEKICGIGQVSDQRLKQIKNILNMIAKKPEIIKLE